MVLRLNAVSQDQNAVAETTFGGNFLFNRDELGDVPSNFNALANDLGVESLRYPGGAITEFMFDLEDPNSTIGYNINGEEQELVGLDDFMSYAESEGKSVTIVLPTRYFLSEHSDLNGDRFSHFDESVVRGFIRDVVEGEYGNAKIDAFEIGNEYWGSGGMTSVEYGRLASKVAAIVDDELEKLEGTADWVQDTDIVVQAGTNYNFSNLSERYPDIKDGDEIIAQLEKDYGLKLSENALRFDGTVNWTAVNNELLLDKFDLPEEIEAVDAVTNHLYTRSHDPAEQQEFALGTISKYWEPHFAGIKTYITEYNQKSNSGEFDDNDFGLKNAHELLNIVEDLTEHGVDQAHVWPLTQWSKNALARGNEYDKLSPTGEMFKMMNEELTGLRSIQFESAKGRETEAATEDNSMNVHAFAGEGKMVLYIASNSDQNISEDVDLSNLMTGSYDIDVTVLGVEDGELAGSKNATATIEERETDFVIEDGIVQADLNPHEIMQIVIEMPDWTPEMEQILATFENEDVAPLGETSEDLLPLIDVEEPPMEPDDGQEEEDGGFDAFEGLEFLLGLLPLLALFASG
jgi:hypothetical protein